MIGEYIYRLKTTQLRKLPIIILALYAHFTAAITFAQDSISFNKTYDKIYKEIAHKNLDQALLAADSLHEVAQVPELKVRCLVLIARLHQQKENLEKSVEYALKAERLAEETGLAEWQARANGLLAGQYRMMELYAKANKYSQRALELIPQIKDAEKANSTRALMLQELAFGCKDQEQYRQAIDYLKQAGASLLKVTDNREFMIMSNDRLLGDNYRLLESFDTAIIFYRSALALSSHKPTHYITGLIHRGLAEAWLGKGNLKEAKEYLIKAEHIANESQYLQLKEAVYATAKAYYAQVEDQERLATAREKKDSATGAILEKRAELLDKNYARLENREEEVATMSNIKTLLALFISVLLVGSIAFFMIYRRKKQKELAQFKSTLEQLRLREQEAGDINAAVVDRPIEKPSSETRNVEEKGNAENREKSIMTTETEQKLLMELDSFEQSTTFVDNNLSLSSLATLMNTNTKYLSAVIKTYKETDFNSYVNGLRVNYVIGKLRTNPEWRKYKIKTLATEAGFSSHSQFATIFKTVTGLSPSVFIRYLAEEEDQQS
ncbi:MAG: helix-turn-helix domain-containing protein [Agriterribacter sp.]